MTFADAIVSGFKNYANFKGKATRAEFWYWVLFTILLSLVLGTIETVIWPAAPVDSEDLSVILQSAFSAPTPFTSLANIVLFIPGLAVSARRFHDAGFSAKWLLLLLAPAAYSIFAIIGVVAIGMSYSDSELVNIEDFPVELLMSIIFLIAPIFAAMGRCTVTADAADGDINGSDGGMRRASVNADHSGRQACRHVHGQCHIRFTKTLI